MRIETSAIVHDMSKAKVWAPLIKLLH